MNNNIKIMKQIIFCIAITVFSIGCAIGGLAEQLQNLSVTVHAGGAQGSGVLISRDGANYILTAGHVVQGVRSMSEYTDGLSGKSKMLPKFGTVNIVREIVKNGRSIGKMSIEADVIAYSSSEYGDDLALLKLRDSITTESVKFDMSDVIPVTGTKICHVGSFLGQDGSNSYSEGLISQVGRVIYDHPFDQSSASAFPGSSGGGIFNMDGQYIGTLVRGASETFTFYVPIRRIREWARRHNVEFIFDINVKPDESKIVLEGLEPQSSSFTSSRSSETHFMIRYTEDSK